MISRAQFPALNTFVMVAEKLNFRAVADALGVSASAVSQQINGRAAHLSGAVQRVTDQHGGHVAGAFRKRPHGGRDNECSIGHDVFNPSLRGGRLAFVLQPLLV